MIQPAIFTTALALAFAAVLALVLFSGRLSPIARRRVEVALRVVALGVFIPVYGWGLVSMIRDGDWLWPAVQPIVWIWVAISLMREQRRKKAASNRQPGTFY
ncbi:MAG: hypothetical protein EON88_36520 [Brevundimonas sp.]|nr:MAG: hypothetical protein EON88_36520 [Brevundimonas sp.]